MVEKPQAPAIVTLRDVTKIYDTAAGGTVHALSKINLDSAMPVSSFPCSARPGAARPRLLRIIGGLEDGYGGELKLRGRSGGGSRQDVGIVFQDANLLPWRSILQNVLLPAQVLKLDKDASLVRARELLELVGLEGLRGQVSVRAVRRHAPACLHCTITDP